MNGFLNKNLKSYAKNWLAPVKYAEMQSKNAVRNQYTNLYAYGANNPVHYIDPDGRIITWNKDDNISEGDFQKVKDEAELLANSDTIAGKRYLELAGSQEFVVNIWVTSKDSSKAYACNEEDACNGIGSDVGVIINLNENGVRTDGIKHTLGDMIAHEVSGHAYEITKGRFHINSSNSTFSNEAIFRGKDEEVAVAMQNEYRAYLGLNQRKKYKGYRNTWNMPIYDSKTKTWSIKDLQTGKTRKWRLPE